MHDTSFPQLVKDVRKQLGLSQEELAHKLGVSFATLNRWENRKTSPSKLALNQFNAYIQKMLKKDKSISQETVNDFFTKTQQGNK